MIQSKLLGLLPEIYRAGVNGDASFLNNYVKIIEYLLLEVEDRRTELVHQKGVGEIIGILQDLFHPETELMSGQDAALFESCFTAERDEFLEWLAGWFAFVLDEDWSLEKKINVLAKVVVLYRKRGTKEGMQEYLELYKPGGSEKVQIVDEAGPMVMGGINTVSGSKLQLGVDTYIGGMPSHFFKVTINIPSPDPAIMKEQLDATRKIIDREKPAHTHYLIDPITPVMLLGVKLAGETDESKGFRCRIGMDTLLGEKYTGRPLSDADLPKPPGAETPQP